MYHTACDFALYHMVIIYICTCYIQLFCFNYNINSGGMVHFGTTETDTITIDYTYFKKSGNEYRLPEEFLEDEDEDKWVNQVRLNVNFYTIEMVNFDKDINYMVQDMVKTDNFDWKAGFEPMERKQNEGESAGTYSQFHFLYKFSIIHEISHKFCMIFSKSLAKKKKN